MKLLIVIVLIMCFSGTFGRTIMTLKNLCIKDFNTAILEAHNIYRARHGVPSMKTNKKISKDAQDFADYLGTNGLFKHSGNPLYGENIAAEWTSYVPDVKNCSKWGFKFTKMWYDEIAKYDFNNPSMDETGHFTQVVWAKSIELGCGLSVDDTNRAVGVCNYNPPGNYVGQVAANVKPLVSSS